MKKVYSWIEKGTESKAKAPVNQACLRAKLLFDDGKFLEASNEFKTICQKYGQDAFSFIALANIAFLNGISCGQALGQRMPRNE